MSPRANRDEQDSDEERLGSRRAPAVEVGGDMREPVVRSHRG